MSGFAVNSNVSSKARDLKCGRNSLATGETIALDHVAHVRPGKTRGAAARNSIAPHELAFREVVAFYETCGSDAKVALLVRLLFWPPNLLILGRCKLAEERGFYLRLFCRERWGRRELEPQLKGALFERAVLCPAKVSPQVTQFQPVAERNFNDTYLLANCDLKGDKGRERCPSETSSHRLYPNLLEWICRPFRARESAHRLFPGRCPGAVLLRPLWGSPLPERLPIEPTEIIEPMSEYRLTRHLPKKLKNSLATIEEIEKELGASQFSL